MPAQDRIDAFTVALLSLLPPGTAMTREPGSNVVKLVSGLGVEFARIEERLVTLQLENLPHETTELIEDWYEVLGLPDVTLADGTDDEKRTQIAVRLLGIIGHSWPALQATAASLGYEPIWRERPSMFEAGASGAGDPCGSRLWANTLYIFYVTGSRDAALEAALERARRAHATFIYSAESPPVVPGALVMDGDVVTMGGDIVFM